MLNVGVIDVLVWAESFCAGGEPPGPPFFFRLRRAFFLSPAAGLLRGYSCAVVVVLCILVLPEYTTLMSTVHHSHEFAVYVQVFRPHFAEMLSKSSLILLRTPPETPVLQVVCLSVGFSV